jgi:hypothetical protein
MKPVLTRCTVAVLCLLIAGTSGISHGAIADHLQWGQIIQGQVFDDPNTPEVLLFFLLKLETDAHVEHVEFITPGGLVDVIPNDPSTAWGDVETYHWVRGLVHIWPSESTHIWEYWAYPPDARALADYGDGEYVITLYYTDGTAEQTTVWYGIPDTSWWILAPAQRPSVSWPTYHAAIASPVTFTWSPVTDPAVSDISLAVLDANDEYVVWEVYDTNATASDPYELREAPYDMEFALENFYAIINPDGVPFDLLKSSALLQPFEGVCSTVYRFWSPVTGGHFYTASESEKEDIRANYSHFWTFEGPAFYAWATKYYDGLTPVYRFWSGTFGHFYTIDEAERDWLIANYSHVWTYEGVAFYAWRADDRPTDTQPVHRFLNTAEGCHFFTIDAAEADKLRTTYADTYTYEGIAFYAWP